MYIRTTSTEVSKGDIMLGRTLVRLKKIKIPRGKLEEMLHSQYDCFELEKIATFLICSEAKMDREPFQHSCNLNYYIRTIRRVLMEKKKEQGKHNNPFNFLSKEKKLRLVA